MKRLTITFSFLFVCVFVYSQVEFENISLSEAMKKGQETNKIVFAQFVSSNCLQCNEVADKAFEDKDLAKVVKERCVAIKIELAKPDRQLFIENYNPTEGIGTFFIRSDGDLVYRTFKTTSQSKHYVDEIDNAYNKLTESRLALQQLNDLWTSTHDILSMEMNLTRRKELYLPVDSLLDIYTEKLPTDSLSSFRVLQFIASMSPILKSKPDSVLRKDGDIFSQAWYRLGLIERININNRIIAKSLQKSIAQKNLELATATCNFAWNIHAGGNKEIARKRYDYTWMTYYKETADTLHYCRVAISMYDNYYMKVSTDSIKKVDSLSDIKMNASKSKNDTIQSSSNKQIIRRSFIKSSYQSQRYSTELQDGAISLYKFDNTKLFTTKVLAYAKYALEFYPSPEAMNTYAKLLYKTGEKQQAIEWQEKAIALLKKRIFNSERFEKVLNSMKNGEDVQL